MESHELRKLLTEAATNSKVFTVNSTVGDLINEAVKEQQKVPIQNLGAFFTFRWGTVYSD
jgi:nucleoid DNA-binding protein